MLSWDDYNKDEQAPGMAATPAVQVDEPQTALEAQITVPEPAPVAEPIPAPEPTPAPAVAAAPARSG